MNNQAVLKGHVNSLLNSAISRNTKQGVLVYEKILDELEDDLSDKNLTQCLLTLIKALNGIEAHGYFTREEFDIVKSIRQMK